MKVDPAGKLLLGLAAGVAFGGLLQKGRVAKYEVILDQLLLKDWTVLKIMGTAVAVGSIGVHALERLGLTKLSVKPMNAGGITIGAAIFGAGMAILGYCPGTCVAAVGEGRSDAAAGLFGMLAGAGAFVALYPKLKPIIESGSLGKVTLPTLTGTSPWPWVMGLASVVSLGATALESRE
ncbi:MAG: YeeE/YedE family protein [Polyangiaceae bacterium]|nr:YeeE/YedE family protein [Polyangiaceae bacterium]